MKKIIVKIASCDIFAPPIKRIHIAIENNIAGYFHNQVQEIEARQLML